MLIPTAVFLDTSVLEGQSYNFSSTTLSTFIPACRHRNVKLLLPDPIEREIKRHMAELSTQAVSLIEKARRTAPFLAKWKGFPAGEARKGEVSMVTVAEWTSFLRQFDVVRLNYDAVRLAQVMNWYDATEPPFDTGKKRREFPDAFAIAILAAYAERNGCFIAVVSHDKDMKRACDRFPSLMYFHSLPVLTELLLSAEDGRIASLRAVLDGSIDKIAEAAYEASMDLSFYDKDDYTEIEDNDVLDVSIADLRVVAIGEHECTVAFDAVISVRHQVKWFVQGPDNETGYERQTVTNDYDVSGTAKASFDAATKVLVGIPYVSLNEEQILAKDLPPYWERW